VTSVPPWAIHLPLPDAAETGLEFWGAVKLGAASTFNAASFFEGCCDDGWEIVVVANGFKALWPETELPFEPNGASIGADDIDALLPGADDEAITSLPLLPSAFDESEPVVGGSNRADPAKGFGTGDLSDTRIISVPQPVSKTQRPQVVRKRNADFEYTGDLQNKASKRLA
jgi:hypothetical protein